ncbi:MAG: 16S rRNA (guanine(966)-N(2))-methyltransferase RsmD [Chloroflexota bacterium]
MRIGGGKAGGRRLRKRRGPTRAEDGLRPTTARVRGAIFNILGPGRVQERRVLDLYAGTGSLGLEALSHGAHSAEFVEANGSRREEIREAARRLGLGEAAVLHRGPVEKVLARLEGRFGVVFIDPPFKDNPFDWILRTISEKDMLEPDGMVFAEHSKHTELLDEYGHLALADRRRYGDAVVSIYQLSDRGGDEQGKGR